MLLNSVTHNRMLTGLSRQICLMQALAVFWNDMWLASGFHWLSQAGHCLPWKQGSVFDHELLAAYHAVCHFHSAIKGRYCTLFTDHHPMVQAFCCSYNLLSPEQQGHLSALTEFLSDVLYQPGHLSVMADSLSRCPAPTLSTVMPPEF